MPSQRNHRSPRRSRPYEITPNVTEEAPITRAEFDEMLGLVKTTLAIIILKTPPHVVQQAIANEEVILDEWRAARQVLNQDNEDGETVQSVATQLLAMPTIRNEQPEAEASNTTNHYSDDLRHQIQELQCRIQQLETLVDPHKQLLSEDPEK